MLDDLDRALIHALQLDGRAPFARIGAVLGVSTQTVARRYRRLRAEAGLRVVGLPDPHRTGQAQWLVRLTVVPGVAQRVATALVRRTDTTWVKLAGGGTEICAVVLTPAEHDHSLLLRDIPRTAGITGVSAHRMLHTYLGGPSAWRGRVDGLTEEQQAQFTADVSPRPMAPAETDAALFTALGHEGRAGQAELAAATGRSPAVVARRIADLRAAGALFFDVEIDAALFGATTQALLWMAVAPADLDTVGTTLAEHRELAVVAATTGPTNLLAHALCTDAADLHRYLTQRLGAITGVRACETAPVLRTLKAASPIGTPIPARIGPSERATG
ncbi:AsnC family transcriptional regulator [Amycolatopsis rhabdoformis]|uniref:AsnC family transcriptional regulator n=1 Tax=Amycolatopsis rhabdoformis TaxID=1448059 RepID=A0ABZ1I876_9PSEU|nr:AsnC family transcriptional regulator [Amycolatopsis rhabdoformis]WSE30615.1 AsnC family transcriptional regulator [Amycolatopsis rhabdoformis]